jgi:YesN/AraC family two-component response regulator
MMTSPNRTSSIQPAAAANATVLVVDDEALTRRTLRARLAAEGCHVLEAATATAALEQLGDTISPKTDVEHHLHMRFLWSQPYDRSGRCLMSAAQVHVRRMLDRIEQSYSEPITLHWFAADLHRQGAYLGAIFRREVGVPMREWLTRVRLDHAAALVREGVKIEAVSMLVGYRSKKNFYRQFKRRFGTTPFAHGIAARNDANATGTCGPVSA